MDWKITCKKVVKNAVYVIIAGLAVRYGNSSWYIGLAPAIMGIENAVKHWND